MKWPRREHMQFPPDVESSPQLYYSKILGPFYRGKLGLHMTFLPKEGIGKLLEVGFGSGIALKEFASRAKTVFAIDIHEYHSAVEKMLTGEGIDNVRLFRHNIFDEAFTEARGFDYVVSSSTFEHIPGGVLSKGIANISNILKPEGSLIVGFPLKNRLMDFLFKMYEQTYQRLKAKMYRFTLDEDHPSGQNEIIPELKKFFTIEKMKFYPSPFLRLYVVLKCRKNGNVTQSQPI